MHNTYIIIHQHMAHHVLNPSQLKAILAVISETVFSSVSAYSLYLTHELIKLIRCKGLDSGDRKVVFQNAKTL